MQDTAQRTMKTVGRNNPGDAVKYRGTEGGVSRIFGAKSNTII